MDEALDYIISTTWLKIILFLFAVVIIVVMWYLKPFQNNILNRIMQVVVSLSLFCGILYLEMGSSGFAVDFVDGKTNGKVLCLAEKHQKSDGENGYIDAYRLYVLDVETGERIYRIPIAYPEILAVTENAVVVYEANTAVEYDLVEGNKLREWSTEKGFEKFPELKSGILNMSRRSSSIGNQELSFLTLSAMNGHNYYFDFRTEELTEGEYLPFTDAGLVRFNQSAVTQHQQDGREKGAFRFETVTGEVKKLVYKDYYGDPVRFQGEFLKPEIIALSSGENFFVVKHFETLEFKNAKLTAINFDLTMRWELTQSNLDLVDEYQEEPIIGTCIQINNYLVVTFGGCVLSINCNDGQIIWRSRQ